jgi:glutamyl-tRNA synthetase
MDDLVIARPDGTPTYNFCVVVDDWDMKITHVIRGDDHVNNTPRQINILKALGAEVPVYGHVPMILGADGEKLSKRHGAVSVMEYPAQGFLPEAMLNYLARLGWSHGDEEIFTMEQFCAWFDLDHLTKSPAQFNPEKLAWLNNHYIKAADNARLATLVGPVLEAQGAVTAGGPDVQAAIGLMKERAHTINDLALSCLMFYREPQPEPALMAEHLSDVVKPALTEYATQLKAVEWNRPALAALMKGLLAAHKLKMPQLAMPLRLMLTGQLQTPSIDAVVELIGRDTVVARIEKHL